MIILLQNILTGDQAAAMIADLERGKDDAASGALYERHDAVIGSALMSHEPFANAILPISLTPFRFDRHDPGSEPEDRMESPLAGLGAPHSMRIDAVCAVFLTDPESYDGGELMVDASTSPVPIKLPAGDAVIFPATDFYATSPITLGGQWIATCGVQSAVRGTREREILTEMWVALNDFKAMPPSENSENTDGPDGVKILGKARSNLIRLLADGS